MSALLAASVQAKQHASRIQAAVARVPHLRGAHADIRARLDCREQSFQPSGVRSSVVIQHSKERSP